MLILTRRIGETVCRERCDRSPRLLAPISLLFLVTLVYLFSMDRDVLRRSQ
jgi:hypothetical protein